MQIKVLTFELPVVYRAEKASQIHAQGIPDSYTHRPTVSWRLSVIQSLCSALLSVPWCSSGLLSLSRCNFCNYQTETSGQSVLSNNEV